MNIEKFNNDMHEIASRIYNRKSVPMSIVTPLTIALLRADLPLDLLPEQMREQAAKVTEQGKENAYGLTGDFGAYSTNVMYDLRRQCGTQLWKEIQERFSVAMVSAMLYTGSESAFKSFPVAFRYLLALELGLAQAINLNNYSGIIYFSPNDSAQYRAYSGFELVFGVAHAKHDPAPITLFESMLAGQSGMDTYDPNSWALLQQENIQFHMGYWSTSSTQYRKPSEQEKATIESTLLAYRNNPNLFN